MIRSADAVPRRSSLARQFESYLTTERHLLGCAVLRICVGSLVLSYLVGHWAQREFLWGSNGVYPLWLFERERAHLRWPSLFAVESGPLFDALYLAAIAVAALYTIGWRARWLALPIYVCTSSLFARNPAILTGGDNLLLVQLPFLLALNTSAFLSVDSGWRLPGAPFQPPPRPLAALLHNMALIGVVAQLCIAYEFAGLYKVMGAPWQDGTAVYYALRRPEFNLPGISPMLYINPVVVTLLTYGTVAFEIAYPFLVLHRSTRWLGVLLAALFHAGIATVMGLVLFAAEMLTFQVVLLDDRAYRSAWEAVGRGARWLSRPLARHLQSVDGARR